MRIRYYLLLALFIFYSLLNSTTWHIKQDGTGNFTTIQEGIISATDMDTVLVYPGIYYENIDYLEKSITVASLYIITPEDSLINQTIIDGNQQFRCVTIDDCADAAIIGLTIQNGLADDTHGLYGGGLRCDYSDLIISNCYIKNNTAFSGGGVHLNQSNTLLKCNTISHNISLSKGGGIYINGNNSSTIFHSEFMNNIYLNYGGNGNDVAASNIIEPINVFVDTFTVNELNSFFITPTQYFTFSTENYKIEQIDQDLYVAPEGDDNNSGLIPEEPLKTISWAQTLIKRNDDNPNTIHLAPGIYSPSMNDQKYPLNIKHGVRIVGSSTEETILDAEEQTPFIFFNSKEDIYVSLNLQDMTLINAQTFEFPTAGAINITYQADMKLENLIIENCYSELRGTIHSRDGFYSFNNIIVKNNSGGHAISLTANHQNQNPVLDVEILNCIIKDNDPGQGQDNGSGGGLILYGHSTIPGDFNAKLINCEISGNHNNFYNPQTGLGGAVGIYIGNDLNADIINCTFGDNTLSYSTGCVISVLGAELNMYNSILHNNDGYSFILWNEEEVNVSHSLIESGDSNVFYYGSGAINWMEGNLDEDPLWVMSGDYPYYLQSTSPCINTGTLDLPAGIELPEYDLAGNPRIYGETIDMGAYEWQGTGVSEEELVVSNWELSNYPNPFNPSTTISFSIPNNSKVNISIYNLRGQKIKDLSPSLCHPELVEGRGANNYTIKWNGTDENNKSVSSGIYFYRLETGSKTVTKKMLLLK